MENKIAIVTDSGASLPDKMRIQEHCGDNIIEIPFTVVVSKNGKIYRSWIDHPLSGDERLEFINDLNNDSLKITTSQPNPEDYMRAFDSVISSGVTEIAVVPMSSSLSGSIQSANIAASIINDKDVANIVVADCKKVSVSQGLLLTQVDFEKKRGKFTSANELINRIEEMSANSIEAQGFSSLENLRKNGRIGRAAVLFGGVFGVIPIIGLNPEGSLEPIGKRRGWEKSRRFITDYMSREVGKCAVRLAVVQFGTDKVQFEKLKSDITEKFEIAKDETGVEFEIMECEQSNVLCVHTGPGVVGLGALAIESSH